jgi:HEAT repeat protein
LIGLLASPRPVVRQQAALALGKIGPGAAEAVSALTAALDDSEWSVRRQAALALGDIGAASCPALPALERLEHDRSGLVSQAARAARDRIAASGN